ncbi:MAG: hypothetical protein IJO70_07095 [Lachnospiraceae bacterium]|nr:hypothetical protein [Lachnospiraceae bacterium]
MSEVSTEENTTTEDVNYIDEANIKEVNDNSYMGIELNQDSGLSEEEAKMYGGEYPYIIYTEEGDTEYYCFRYPNYDAPLTVTQISIEDSKYNVFGISLGDDITNSEKILQEKGYTKTDYPVENSCLYIKGDVMILLYYDEATIEKIVVCLDFETEEGVMY